jgi:hypothetical protein
VWGGRGPRCAKTKFPPCRFKDFGVTYRMSEARGYSTLEALVEASTNGCRWPPTWQLQLQRHRFRPDLAAIVEERELEQLDILSDLLDVMTPSAQDERKINDIWEENRYHTALDLEKAYKLAWRLRLENNHIMATIVRQRDRLESALEQIRILQAENWKLKADNTQVVHMFNGFKNHYWDMLLENRELIDKVETLERKLWLNDTERCHVLEKNRDFVNSWNEINGKYVAVKAELQQAKDEIQRLKQKYESPNAFELKAESPEPVHNKENSGQIYWLFIKGFPATADDRKVVKFFAKLCHCKPRDVHLIRAPKTPWMAQVGFVKESIPKRLLELDSVLFGSSKLSISRFNPTHGTMRSNPLPR